MSKILMGSQYFFSQYDDFNSKDIDEIEIIETSDFNNMRQLTGMGKCFFQLKKLHSADDYINRALESKLGMVIGKFLVPEFCQEIGMNVSDLSKLAPLLELLDKQHEYEKIIYNSYIENNSFTLTNA
jgi:hypothetical protein